MWSLSVEEQFYLLWPLTILVLAGRRHRLALVCGSLAIVSIVYRLSLAGTSILAVYYGSICVSCALLAGCLVACLERRMSRPWTGWMVGAPLAGVVGVYVVATVWGPWPVGWTGAIALPLVGAVTAVGLPHAARMSWLGWRPLGAMGHGIDSARQYTFVNPHGKHIAVEIDARFGVPIRRWLDIAVDANTPYSAIGPGALMSVHLHATSQGHAGSFTHGIRLSRNPRAIVG
jgi:hypothetical protein